MRREICGLCDSLVRDDGSCGCEPKSLLGMAQSVSTDIIEMAKTARDYVKTLDVHISQAQDKLNALRLLDDIVAVANYAVQAIEMSETKGCGDD